MLSTVHEGEMKRWLKDNRGLLVLLLFFGFFRAAVADWNPVPSGSMRPTILEGDVVFVNRLAYDFKIPLTNSSLVRLADPQRGDVVTFSSPRDGTRLIKRIVAIPGDVVEMRDETLYVNGQGARYTDLATASEQIRRGFAVPATQAIENMGGHSRTVQFLPAVAARRNFGPLQIPAGRYFMLGDNRANSEDSRYIGTVPRELIIGQANHIVVSADIIGDWLPRLERTAAPLH
jgi:signal peptidase I